MSAASKTRTGMIAVKAASKMIAPCMLHRRVHFRFYLNCNVVDIATLMNTSLFSEVLPLTSGPSA
jgi:hypothetical protein